MITLENSNWNKDCKILSIYKFQMSNTIWNVELKIINMWFYKECFNISVVMKSIYQTKLTKLKLISSRWILQTIYKRVDQVNTPQWIADLPVYCLYNLRIRWYLCAYRKYFLTQLTLIKACFCSTMKTWNASSVVLFLIFLWFWVFVCFVC